MKYYNILPQAKFLCPQPGQNVIMRAQAVKKMRQAFNYPLTVVRAGAGYGKSTLLYQAFSDAPCMLAWLNLSERENGAVPFLYYLLHAIKRVCPRVGETALGLLGWDERQGQCDVFAVLQHLVQDLADHVTRTLVMVLDDFQFVGNNREVLQVVDTLAGLLPPHVHLVIASREKVVLPTMALQRATRLWEVTEEDLAFSVEEIRHLFRHVYATTLDLSRARQLAARTEGWVMALHMFGQRLQRQAAWTGVLTAVSASLTELFESLARDMLAQQSSGLRQFLVYSAHLQRLKATECDQILRIDGSAAYLRELARRGMFTIAQGDGNYRYHHLFQEFLRKNGGLDGAAVLALHKRAADYYRAHGAEDLAVEHYLQAACWPQAVAALKAITPHRLSGQLYADLARWLQLLPGEVLAHEPELLLCRGDICRYASDFAGALKYYQAAERGFQHNGDADGAYAVAKAFAMVYLDTVQPALAEVYLQQALMLLPPHNLQERAKLLELMAENNTNLGQAEQAAVCLRQANELFLEDSRGDLEARMHLRTGRLLTAKKMLLDRMAAQTEQQLPHAHREPPLLLSLINVFIGDIAAAWDNAREGINVGRHTRSPFVEAVGYMRLGHAKQLCRWDDADDAVRCYERALEITGELGVERGKVEALWGLSLFYGHRGDLDSAQRYGLEALRIICRAQDEWMAAMVKLALGVVNFKNGAVQAASQWLDEAARDTMRCGDIYLSSLAHLWQARLLLTTDADARRLDALLDKLLLDLQTHGFDFILLKPTFLGIRDVQAVVPLLLRAQQKNIRADYANSLLLELTGCRVPEHHPGYSLRVQALGPFRVWRGMTLVQPREWQREKSRRLLQYFITYRQELRHKEQIIEDLWGDAGSDRDFKVALHAMITALEPTHRARCGSFYVVRHGSHYGLNLAAGILFDVDEFESLISRGKQMLPRDVQYGIQLFRQALNLYKGDFLAECCYEDWCSAERERLLTLYITTAQQLAEMLYDNGEWEEAISLANRILGKDRCWEAAYRLLMRCYDVQSNGSMVVRVYRQCAENLARELKVEPSLETRNLFKNLQGRLQNIC